MSIKSHVPHAIVERLTRLGAVTAGVLLVERYAYGVRQLVPFTDLVHFFDRDNREVGYWSVLTPYNNDEPTIFAPNHRVWHESMLAKLQMETYVQPLRAET